MATLARAPASALPRDERFFLVRARTIGPAFSFPFSPGVPPFPLRSHERTAASPATVPAARGDATLNPLHGRIGSLRVRRGSANGDSGAGARIGFAARRALLPGL